jgi:pyrroline-5-carboxylate reductase
VTPPFDGRLLLVGCGTMAGAMLDRWLVCGLAPEQVTAVSPSGRPMPGGVTVLRAVPADAGSYDLVMLGLKPQQLGSLAKTPLAGARPPLLVSILAGVEEATLAALTGAGAVVRAMPNLPVAIGRGVTALASAGAGPDDRRRVAALMAPLGVVEWIEDEGLFDAVTALSGCGPAFVYRFVDALAGGGAALGLPPEQAVRLAIATADGAAGLAAASDATPEVLADRVASPGGSTRAGLDVLDREGALAALLRDTLAASARRNAALAALAR